MVKIKWENGTIFDLEKIKEDQRAQHLFCLKLKNFFARTAPKSLSLEAQSSVTGIIWCAD